MTMQRTLLISLVLVAAAIALVMGGVRGMQDGGARFSDLPALSGGDSPLGFHDGGA
jgi:hypothetical protein